MMFCDAYFATAFAKWDNTCLLAKKDSVYLLNIACMIGC